jgi:hypothetical protein
VLSNRRTYHIEITENESGWGLTYDVEANVEGSPTHVSRLRAHAVTLAAEQFTKSACELRRGKLDA